MQLQESHRHRQLNGQESQGLQTRLSRCFFLTKDQDRWKFQLFTIVRTSGSSVSLRRNSLMQHNGYMLRHWVFGWIHHVKTTLRVLNIVDAASEMHTAIQNLIVRRWDRWKAMKGICDKLENFRQYLMSCQMSRNSCVWHHLQKETIPMSAPNMVYPDNRI